MFEKSLKITKNIKVMNRAWVLWLKLKTRLTVSKEIKMFEEWSNLKWNTKISFQETRLTVKSESCKNSESKSKWRSVKISNIIKNKLLSFLIILREICINSLKKSEIKTEFWETNLEPQNEFDTDSF